MNESFDRMITNMKNYFAQVENICVTADLWTAAKRGKALKSPNATRWNSYYDVSELLNSKRDKIESVFRKMVIPQLVDEDVEFIHEFVKVSSFHRSKFMATRNLTEISHELTQGQDYEADQICNVSNLNTFPLAP